MDDQEDVGQEQPQPAPAQQPQGAIAQQQGTISTQDYFSSRQQEAAPAQPQAQQNQGASTQDYFSQRQQRPDQEQQGERPGSNSTEAYFQSRQPADPSLAQAGPGFTNFANPEHQRAINDWRSRLANSEESTTSWFGRRGVGFFSPIVEAKNNVFYGRSLQRINAGQGTDEDFQRVAVVERLRQLDERNEGEGASFWSKLANASARTFGAITEMALMAGAPGPTAVTQGPRLLSMAGLRSLGTGAGLRAVAAAAPAYAARTAVSTAMMPSMYLPQWIQNNESQNRDALDLMGLPPAFGMGMAQVAVLGSLGEVGNAIPGSSVSAVLRRLGARTATGMMEQQGVDILASATQQAVEGTFGYSLGLPTGYGTLGQMVQLTRGNRHLGDTLGDVAIQALTFAAFSGLHEVQHGAPRQEPQISAGGREFLSAFQEVANGMHAESKTPEQFRDAYQTAHDRITHELQHQQQRGQELDLVSMRRVAESIENPQSRQLAEAMVKVFEDKASPREARAPEAQPAAPEQRPPETPTPAPETSAAPEAQRPAESAPRANPTQPAPRSEGNWQQEYRNQRQRGISHEEAMRRADQIGPQEWQHTGTKITENAKGEAEFKAKNGDRYTLHGEIMENGVRVTAHDVHGEEVGRVLFDRRGKARGEKGSASDYTAGGLSVNEGHTGRGISEAMYDFAHEQFRELQNSNDPLGGRILPSDSQTGDTLQGGQRGGGKAIWQRNAEKAAERARRAETPAAPAPKPPEPAAKVAESLAEKKARIAAEKEQTKQAKEWLEPLGLKGKDAEKEIQALRERGAKLDSFESTVKDYAKMQQEAGTKNVRPPEIVPETPPENRVAQVETPSPESSIARDIPPEHRAAAQHITREMAANPDVGTPAEYFRAINKRRQAKGQAKLSFEQIKKSFEAMEKAGLVERYEPTPGEDPIYVPVERTPPDPRTEAEKQQLYAETRVAQQAYKESLNADRSQRGPEQSPSVRRDVERDVQKASAAIEAAAARREAEGLAQRNTERGAAAAGRSETASDKLAEQRQTIQSERERIRAENERNAKFDAEERARENKDANETLEKNGEPRLSKQDHERIDSEARKQVNAARRLAAAEKIINLRRDTGSPTAAPTPEANVNNPGANGNAPAAANPANAGAGSAAQFSKPIEPSQPIRIVPDDLPNAGEPRRGVAGRGTVVDSVPVPPGNEFSESLARNVLRHENANKVQRMDRDRHAMDAARKYFEVHIEAAPDEATQRQRFADFWREVESGKISDLPTELRQFAEIYSEMKKAYQKELDKREKIDLVIENHVMHIWEDPAHPNATPMDIALSLLSRRPLAGQESFQRRRTIPTYEDGLNAGLKPRSWNPATLAIIEFDQFSKSIFGHDVFHTLRDLGVIEYFGVGQRQHEGWRTLTDKQFRELGIRNNVATVKEVFDKQQMEGLERFARSLGVDVEHAGTIRAPGGEAFGKHEEGKITRRFGTPEEVLAHEIGHELDRRYNLSSWVADPDLAPELQSLADLRASGRPSDDVQRYLRSPAEQAANLITAYLHTPELLAKNAPKVKAKLDALIESRPELHALRDIKPSLELGERDQVLRLQGQAITGHYYMPDPVAKLFENHMMPGLSSMEGAKGVAYRAFRGFGNQMSQFLLGWSGFHATGITLSAQFSKMADVMLMGTRGDFSAKTLMEAVVPGIAAFQTLRKGLKIRKEWDSPGSQSPEYAEMAQYLRESGGRVRGGSDYVSSSIESFSSSMRRLKAGEYGQIPRALYHAIPALNELVSKPVMDYLVPLVKAGAHMDAMRYELMKRPEMTIEQRRDVGGRIWDAMEDHFGLLTYDNLFMNRVVRDSLQTSMLSFGWNLGDVRGLGGGLVDAFKPSMWKGLAAGEGPSRRTAWLISLIAGSAVYGALYQLAATGKPPEDVRDLWFPQTGQLRPDGTADRVSLPTYMKDLAAITNRATDSPLAIPRNAWHMAQGKISPAVRLVGEILSNQDWQGRAIDNPNDPTYRQARDQAMHILKALVPISASQAVQQNQRGVSVPRQLQGFVGITPAPSHIVHSWQQQRDREVNRRIQMTPQERRRRGLAAQ